jgi:two-component system NtrC family sensor kinase
MSLRTKIALGFFLSAFIIAILFAFIYVNFIQIRKEIRFLEVTDTIRSKSLQLRRHEKNFFLYPANAGEESRAIYTYLGQLDAIASELEKSAPEKQSALRETVVQYRQTFRNVEALAGEISEGFDGLKASFVQYSSLFPLIEANFLDRPLKDAQFLESVLGLPPGHEVVRKLRRLDSEIGSLRRTGEDIISVSKDLDRAAREKAENGLRVSQVAILLVFPLFLLIGLGVLFIIGTDVAHRLRTLIRLVEKAGERYVSDEGAPPEIKAGHDEVEVLIRKFRNMEAQLVRWEEELDRKNLELLQSKKLSAIGTLASGVAHELNNPLNNIYVSAQVLKKEMGEECPPFVKGIVEDIAGQTARVKNIVADLLEFARGGEPRLGKVELGGLIRGAYDLAGKSMDTSGVRFDLDADPGGVYLLADREQLERVFINLFTNAVDAMGGAGRLAVAVAEEDGSVKIGVSDTGRGMGAEEREKVFDPFFTTKDKGTGLGLAIVFNSISKHGGEISVQSEPGRGTVFNIKLPKGDVNGL